MDGHMISSISAVFVVYLAFGFILAVFESDSWDGRFYRVSRYSRVERIVLRLSWIFLYPIMLVIRFIGWLIK